MTGNQLGLFEPRPMTRPRHWLHRTVAEDPAIVVGLGERNIMVVGTPHHQDVAVVLGEPIDIGRKGIRPGGTVELQHRIGRPTGDHVLGDRVERVGGRPGSRNASTRRTTAAVPIRVKASASTGVLHSLATK